MCIYNPPSCWTEGVDCHRSRCRRLFRHFDTMIFFSLPAQKGSDVFQLCLLQMQKTRPSWKTNTAFKGVKRCLKKKNKHFLGTENTCLTFFCGRKKPPVSGIPDLRTPNSMVLAIFTALSAFHLVCFNWPPPNYSLLVSYLDHPSTMNFFRIYQTCIYSFGTIVSFDQFFYLAVFCWMFLT